MLALRGDGAETLGSTVVWDIQDHFVQIPSAVDWYLVRASSGTFYWPSKDAISLAYDYAKGWWVAAHEYGHACHHRALGGIHYSVPGIRRLVIAPLK